VSVRFSTLLNPELSGHQARRKKQLQQLDIDMNNFSLRKLDWNVDRGKFNCESINL
jgi:hypothetical protein